MSTARAIRETALLRGSFTLRSGAVSDTYFDKYLFAADPVLLRTICEELSRTLTGSFDALAALEMGGIPIGTVLAQVTGRRVLFVRKEAKTYGTCKYAEGGDYDGKRLLIVEDVVSTGGAIIDAITKLQQDGAIIAGVVCVIDRETGGRENVTRLGIPFTALYTYGYLLSAV